MAQVIEDDTRRVSAWQVETAREVAPGSGLRWRGWRPGLIIALAWVALLILLAILAPVVSPYNPIKQNLDQAVAGPSLQHLLGTDEYGRDVLSRLIWGIRPALLGMAVALLVASVIGLPWGLISGYAGGIADLVLMRVADALLVLPGLVIALAITAALGATLVNAMIAVGIVFSPVLARVMRSGVLIVRDREYVAVTRLYGLSAGHRMITHVLPNALAPVLVQITLLAGISFLVQAALGFLGIGSQPPSASWGDSLSGAYKFISILPAMTLAPGLVIVLTVLAIYRIGDGLRDRLQIPA